MNTALAYPEPYRFSAGMLALAVHLCFFAILYFGFRWQSHPPDAFMVEMWDNLPNAEVVPEQVPTPPVVAPPIQPAKIEPVPVPKVVAPVKADIELHDKQAKKLEAEKKTEAERKAAEKAKAETRAKREAELREEEASLARRSEVKNRIEAENRAAIQTQVGRYQDMIRTKIRRNIVMPPDVPGTAEATFKVTLLPDGSVLDVVLLKSSGNSAYDNATERAIYKAQPLPLPADATLQKMFRELKLNISPGETER